MKKISVFVILCAAFMTVSAQQGTSHDHPLPDATVQKYLTEYLGIFNYNNNGDTSGDNWAYTSTSNSTTNSSGMNPPTVAQSGEVYFVQVNDYWQGENINGGYTGTTNMYNQIKYGVKSIDKVENFSNIGSGKLYYMNNITTNRFFFMARTSSCFMRYETWQFLVGTQYYYPFSSFTSTGRTDNHKYYGKENPSYAATPFRWYNEFSMTSNSSADWGDLAASYDNLKDGGFQVAPHSCSNSLQRNHFTTLYGKESLDQTYTMSVCLYVPSGANMTDIYKCQTYSGNNQPRVFFYVNKLDGALNSSQSTTSGFVADLNWQTSFDKAKSANFGFNPFNNNTGVKEVSKIYRKIEGEDNYTLVQDKLVHNYQNNKTWSDTGLRAPGTDGYDVTYYIVTEVYQCDANGNPDYANGKVSASTNQVIMHVPGRFQYFDLKVDANHSSQFNNESNQLNKSTNHIVNTVTPYVNALTSEVVNGITDIKNNDVFTMNRIEGQTTTALKTVTITGNSTRFSTRTITYTVNGQSKTFSKSNMTLQDLLTEIASVTDDVEATPGDEYEAKYQLAFTPAGATSPTNSNTVSCAGYRTDAQVALAYRSGTPDPVNNADNELYCVDFKFKPIYDGNISSYYIWHNADKRVARVDEVNGNKFYLMKQDNDGNWTINAGELIPDTDGYLNLRIAHEDGSRVHEMENWDLNPTASTLDMFYTVEVLTVGNNSYGNADQATTFVGNAQELAINAEATYTRAEKTSAAGREYRADITWNMNDGMEDNLDKDGLVLDYYTVHRRMYNAATNAYDVITKRYTGDPDGPWNGTYDESDPDGIKIYPGQTLTFTDIFLADPEAHLTAQGFPAYYYVKGHYHLATNPMQANTWLRDASAESNILVKNSNALLGDATSIITAIKDISALSPVVEQAFYNLQGVEITNPESGSVVIVKQRHANGKVTTIKKKY